MKFQKESLILLIGMRNNDWYLVTATKSKGQTNALTAAWCAFGNLCEEPTMTVYIRPQRYTKETY